MTTRVSIARAEAEDFLYKEARMLDANQLHEWQAMMTEDVTYWVPNNQDDYDPRFHISIIWDDWSNLAGRIWRIVDSGINHTQDPPAKMIRLVSNVEVEPAERDDEVLIHSCLILNVYRPMGQRVDDLEARAFAARQQHRLRMVDGAWKIAFKKVSLLENDNQLPAMTHII